MSQPLFIVSHDSDSTAVLVGISKAYWKSVVTVDSLTAAQDLFDQGCRPGGVIMVLDLMSEGGSDIVRHFARWIPHGPIVVLSTRNLHDYEEDAYAAGATLVLSLPIRDKVLGPHLRLFRNKKDSTADAPRSVPATVNTNPPIPGIGTKNTLEVLRDCSRLLGYAFDRPELLSGFSKMLLELLRISKIAIYLRKRTGVFESEKDAKETRLFSLEFVHGIPSTVAECVQLNLDGGTAAWLAKHRKVLRRGEADGPADALGEFDILGVMSAIPLSTAGRISGVLFLGDRVIGESLNDGELTLIYHLAEELSLALRNIHLHDQVRKHSDLMNRMLEQAETGTVLIDSDIEVLHCNRAARDFFNLPAKGEISFNMLPQWLGGMLFEQTKAVEPLAPRFREIADRYLRIGVAPIRLWDGPRSTGAMATVEDQTEIRKAREIALADERSQVTSTIARRLAHEIRNAVTELSTMQQLIPERISEPAFHKTLQGSLQSHTSRVTRLSDQLSYITGDRESPGTKVLVRDVLDHAVENALRYTATANQPTIEADLPAVTVTADRNALLCAMTEIIINAFQANPTDPKLRVACRLEQETILLGFSDNGAGFTKEGSIRGTEAYFTTRNVGLGLGLAVAETIVKRLGGDLNIYERSQNGFADVTLSLPVSV